MPDTHVAALAPSAETWRPVELTGWGRATSAPCLAARPDRIRGLAAALSPPGGRSVIAHGAGRSYGDQALNTGGAAVLTGRLDRILEFDPTSGVVVAEPGVTFRDLHDVFLPRGFAAPVSPGTAFVTLGGAVANDVHGKNQHVAGCFGDHMVWCDLLLPDGSTRRLDAASEPELFRATIGGLGLTGIITAVALRLVRVPSNALVVRRRRFGDLDAFLAGFAEAERASFSVGWIDALARGRALGRGILETAEPSAEGVPPVAPHARRVPIDAPGWALNRWSVAAFNAAYWRRVPPTGTEGLEARDRFLYPLDALLDWNRIYGRRGFHQYQAVLPGAAALRAVLEAVAATGDASFLAVIKVMGAPGRGMLSFARPGFSLALDVPAKPGARDLFARLETLTLEAGGRIYLAKDSLLSAAGFAAMYPEAVAFRALRARIDPTGKLRSDMARRLGLA